ncbi:DNA ligase-like domain-containing protein [Streptomyces sp. NPDC127020]|uniref:hypothetical protein n=1 Tax=Streptomyces sp. NPDC127020 TaxID=3347109 RepID=UPI003659EB60
MTSPELPPGSAAELKWDGYRAQLAHYAGGRVLLRSRQGTDKTTAFPEVRETELALCPMTPAWTVLCRLPLCLIEGEQGTVLCGRASCWTTT